jgi:hypothetical protein
MSRNWCFLFLVASATALSAWRAALGGESPSTRPDGDSIRLPWGTVIKIASFEAHPVWKQSFPPDHPFFAQKYPEGKLSGMHTRYLGRLDGPSVILHENGNLKMLMYCPGGLRCPRFLYQGL